MQKNNKQQKTNSDCARWSAKGEGECRKERGAALGLQHASGAHGLERIFGHAGGGGLAEFRRYPADLRLI